MNETPKGGAFFGPLPTRGIWTALDLTRGQFLFVLLLSIALFVFVDGPLWTHAHESHFLRITVSYLAIPPAVALALHRNGKLRLVILVVASAVLSLLKLVLTAVILVVIGMAQT
jgi:hypothetical protein